MYKRSLFNSLPGMTGLSLMNPWHAARTLLNPQLPEDLKEIRHTRSIMDEANALDPELLKAKFRPVGPMFKKSTIENDYVSNFDPKRFLTFGKRNAFNNIGDMFENTKSLQKKNQLEIMRFGKRGL